MSWPGLFGPRPLWLFDAEDWIAILSRIERVTKMSHRLHGNLFCCFAAFAVRSFFPILLRRALQQLLRFPPRSPVMKDQPMEAPGLDSRLSQISTQLSLLFRAHEGPGQEASAAQMELLQRYCGAIYRYLRSAVPQPEIAEDLCQEFALRFVRGDFRRADPDRGRFRDFVKTSLFNLITDYRRQQRAPDHLQQLPLA